MTETTGTDTQPKFDTDWGDLAYGAWVIIANAHEGDWSAAHTDWQAAAERWRDRFHALLARPTPPVTGSTWLWAQAQEPVPDGPAAGASHDSGNGPVSPDGQTGSGDPGAAQATREKAGLPEYRGEFAQVQIMGHAQRTGWVTDGSLAGAACLDVCDDTGRLIAKIPPQSVYLYLPLQWRPPAPERTAIATAVEAWIDDSEDGDYPEDPF